MRSALLSYLEGMKDDDRPGTKKKGGAKKAYGNIVKYTEDFFGSAATQLLDADNFREITKLANMFLFDDVPLIYCKALTKLLEILSKVVAAWQNEKIRKEKKTSVSLEASDMSLVLLHEEYARLEILPKIYSNATDFASKLNSLNISYFKVPAGRAMKFAILHFESFAKEFLLNDIFDVDMLKEDIQNFDDEFKMLRTMDDFSVESAFEDFSDQLQRNKAGGEYDKKLRIFSEFDDAAEDDQAAGMNAKKMFCIGWVEYLLTTIKKIFYDTNFVNNISIDCRDELSRFVGYLESEKQNY